MKKIILCLLLAFVLVLSMTGCTENKNQSSIPEESSIEKAETEIEKIAFDDNEMYAIAYLGYEKQDDFSYYVDKYSLNENMPVHFFSEGEYYLVIPRYSNMDLALYKNDMNTSEPSLVYESKAVEPFIIQCNVSDIFPDAKICLTYENEKIEFSPFVSLKDGSIEVGEKGKDITK